MVGVVVGWSGGVVEGTWRRNGNGGGGMVEGVFFSVLFRIIVPS